MNTPYVKDLALQFNEQAIEGGYVDYQGERFYRISCFDKMPPFFMSIVSDSDHWMFISSNGGLTAGRKNADHALFPYYSDDKISDDAHITGSKTIIHASIDGIPRLWEPFSDNYPGVYRIQRNLYKNFEGNIILFEEENEDWGLTFRYSWSNSDKYGFVKRSEIFNTNSSLLSVKVLDGVQNIIPSGLGENIQQIRSNLADAYKKSEIIQEKGLAVFSLSAVIVDKPIPSESLTASIGYAVGVSEKARLISSKQVTHFRRLGTLVDEHDVRGERGAYFVPVNAELEAGECKEWLIVLDVDQDHSDLIRINNQLKDSNRLAEDIASDIKRGTRNLQNMVWAADGAQVVNQEINANRHFANVLFNVLRGGLPDKGYAIPLEDLKDHIAHFNRQAYKNHETDINALPPDIRYGELLEWAAQRNDADLHRLALEYLPFIFSRRHGDPSRPWNKFSIDIKNSEGERVYNYEGNWRDIFQNWEALAVSYPQFIFGMITKFVNASTVDGYNPYRITKKGIDWEVIEPDDPWSFIGYWGDHQVIYLQKLLEVAYDHFPSQMARMLSKSIFTYANVPYKIKAYKDIVSNPRDTIDFDPAEAHRISKLVEELGVDGKLILDDSGKVIKVSFIEKLLVMILTKFSNYIPEGGIWLNTQRPEWNDANNALVGNGVSMVTLCYMYRFLSFFEKIVDQGPDENYTISKASLGFFNSIRTALTDFNIHPENDMDDRTRRKAVNALGHAGEVYRTAVYSKNEILQKETISQNDVKSFIDIAQGHINHTIRKNRRNDGLYHSYNLVDMSDPDLARISHLYMMLEGQVAVLSAGVLSADRVIELLNVLKSSALYREDQNSYILYPNKDLPQFIEKNNIPKKAVKESALLSILLKSGNKDIIYADDQERYHFNTAFNNSESLIKALDQLQNTDYRKYVEEDRDKILSIYEHIFHHEAFTGRSGTFFGYEGLGSIYWHMVSKLRLAVYENYRWAESSQAEKSTLRKLKELYYDVESGLGNNKKPDEYGAFPMDPYSHTPGHRGAQQPGMTGQVKEDILARFGELGVSVKGGRLCFNPSLLRDDEILERPSVLEFFDNSGQRQNIPLAKSTLGFVYCGIPVIYRYGNGNSIEINYDDRTQDKIPGVEFGEEQSRKVFARDPSIQMIEITFKR